MKVILLQTVDRLGKAGDVVTVKEGYARNFLIPKNIAKEAADQVFLSKEEKKLAPMSAYERRIIHAELSERTDIKAESQGDGFDRHIVIKPR